jgi:hypothetical protein
MAGPFQWQRTARTRVEAWLSEPAFDYFQGSHDGYAELLVTHRRSVLHVRAAGLWVIRDEILSEGMHDVMITFQAAPGIALDRLASDRVGCTTGDHEVASLLAVALTDGATLTVENGEVSPCYGVTVDAPVARVHAKVTGPATFTTIVQAATHSATDGGSWQQQLRADHVRNLAPGLAPLIDVVGGQR